MTDRSTATNLFQDRKFGLFLHWGLYSILGRGEWVQFIEKIPVLEYEKLAQQFRGEKFNADLIARIAVDAGMKYIVLTAKHHDGFCLFDSNLTDYSAAKTAARRDFIAEIAEACHKHGLGFHPYYSLWDWHHPDFVPGDSCRWEKYVAYYHGQVRELCTKYGPVSGMWFDTGGGVGPDYEFDQTADIAHELQPEAAVMCADYWVGEKAGRRSVDNRPRLHGIAVETLSPGVFEICETVNDHYCCCPSDHNFKSVSYLWQYLLEVVGHGGNFLLNIGPQPDGCVDDESAGCLRGLGKLMRTYGDAIYGTRAAVHPRINSNGYTLVRDDRVFFFVTNLTPLLDSMLAQGDPLNSNQGEAVVTFNGVKSMVVSVTTVVSRKALDFRQKATQLQVTLPRHVMTWPNIALEVRVDGAAEMECEIRPETDGSLTLTSEWAAIYSPTPGEPRYFPEVGGPGRIGCWTDPKARVEWLAEIPTAGSYEVLIEQACAGEAAGQPYEITLKEPALHMTRIINHLTGATVEDNRKRTSAGVTVLNASTQPTGNWSEYVSVLLGRVVLPAGPITVTLKPKGDRTVFVDVRNVRLLPIGERTEWDSGVKPTGVL